MADSINDLYLKYVNSVGPVMEEDRYFRYLYEIIRAGQNTISQNHRVEHKQVDEAWLSIIEDSLDAINTIIDKPRRFIATEEEIVPVELARKITAESVRHLSQNTQFIAPSDDGTVHPTKILNVSTKESYDLYENRFIYHLIQRLVTFIDKRTDVIFWSTGDESCDTLSIESSIDDAYEQIEYKLEMKIKNVQSAAENDSDNMQVFMRIDRIRRLVMALRTSPFCKLMTGCATVRSPIQRTNLIMKDPSYRKCYLLWQFLEGYDDVGYTIVTRDSSLAFDEEYLIQMYTNMIGSYAVFKSLTAADSRDAETLKERRRTRKPKFVKEIREEIVEDRNIPDVEIRRVFVEEVTQAQLDAEAALAEEKERTAALEKESGELRERLEAAQNYVEQTEAELNEAKAAIVAAKEAAEQERLQLLEENRRAIEEADAKNAAEMAELRTRTDERVAAIRSTADEEISAAAAAAAETVRKTQEEAAETVRTAEEASLAARRDADEQIAAARRFADESIAAADAEARSRIANVEAESEEKILSARAIAEQTAADARAEMERGIAEAKRLAEEETAAARAEADSAVETAARDTAAAREEADRRIAAAETASAQGIADARAAAEKEIAETRAGAEREITEARTAAEKEIADARKASEQGIAEARMASEQGIAGARADAERGIAEAKASADEEVAAARRTADEQVAEARSSADASVSEAVKRQKAAERELETLNRKLKALEEENRKLEKYRSEAQASARQLSAELRKEKNLRSEAEKKAQKAAHRADREAKARNNAIKKAKKQG